MTKFLLKTVCASLCLMACSCSSEDLPGGPTAKTRVDVPLTNTGKEINQNIVDFSIDMMKKQLVSTDQNSAISPLSTSYLLGMLLNGAGGDNYQEMLSAMKLDNYSLPEINEYMKTMTSTLKDLDNTATFSCANSIWAKTGFTLLPAFVTLNKSTYNADVNSNQPFDATTVKAINDWCAEKTNNKIDRIIKDGELENIKAVLTNALYFKASWGDKFNARDTKTEKFTIGSGTQVDVPMMHKTQDMECVDDDKVKMVRLPYGNGAYAMSVLMPANENENINDFINSLDATSFKSMLHASYTRKVHLSLPRFSINYENEEMIHLLESLGINKTFQSEANFKNMTDDSYYVQAIRQKLAIDVDENGTVAAVVTSTTGYTVNYEPEVTINFNRPFLFVISEYSTGAILFAGKIVNPSQL